jgi:hypothetical protein
VHLLGEESIEGSENPDGSLFMDENNFPWGLLVPADWINPEETRRIEEYYPNFTPWRLSGGSEHRDWYLNYVDPLTDPDVYVAGYYPNSSKIFVASVWKNGTETSLGDGVVHSFAYDIAVDANGKTYVAGTENVTTNRRAVYWFDGGAAVNLPLGSGGQTPSEARAIHIAASGSVYITGYYTNSSGEKRACYWVDGTGPVELSGSGGDTANAVWEGNEIYIGGQSSSKAVYWTVGDGRTDLSSGSLDAANGLMVDGGTLYVAGKYNDGSNRAAYWSDDGADGVSVSETDLTGGTDDAASSIWISDIGEVYVGGYYTSGEQIACYWKDGGAPVDMAGGSGGAVNGLQLWEADLYASGYYVEGSKQIACYWKNDERIDLATGTDDGFNAYAGGLVLVE